VAYVRTFKSNFEEILNPNLSNGDYFYATNNVFVKIPLLILNILLILLAIYSGFYGYYEYIASILAL